MFNNYAEVAFQIRIVKDKRKTKYASEHQVMDIDIPTVVGPKSTAMLLRRTELTYTHNKMVRI